jgi:nitrous oxidase accessory protein
MTIRAAMFFVFVTLAGALCAAAGEFDLHGAIAAAPEGAEIVVPSGTYAGPIAIDKPLKLIASGKVILDGRGTGDVVRISAPDVLLRGFVIRNGGTSLEKENAGVSVTAPRATIENNLVEDVLFGLLLKNAPESIIRRNTITGKKIDIARRGDGIRLWQAAGTLVEDNTVRDSRDVVMWFSADITLRRNTVTSSRYGMHFMYTDNNVLEENHLEDNSVGAFLMYSKNLTVRRNVFVRNRGPSGYGLGLKDMENIVAEDNLFLANRVGAYLDNSPHAFNVFDDVRRNVFACNDIGLAFLPNVKRNRFAGNTFMENLQQVAVIGSGNFSGNDFTVEDRGNFWSDYRGYDLDGNGIGDLPYREASLFENLMEREPKLRLFLHSPAQQAIDLASRAFPIMQPQYRVTDDAPLMRPAKFDAAISAIHKETTSMWWAASALLLGSVITLSLARPLRSAARSSKGICQ